MRHILAEVEKIKNTNLTILLTGETGVGKDHLAEYIHYNSNRAEKPFENVCTTTIPAELWESELFGRRKDAYTGARSDRTGILARANGGTVYLNEISEIPVSIQAKFLQFLDTKEIRPIGSNQSTNLDVRIIASTNRDVAEAIASGHLRKDLYYRLSSDRFEIPPLRERREDIPALMEHFLGLRNLPEGKIRRLLDSPVGVMFQQASWPGNVRQLKAVVGRLVTFFNGADDDQLVILAREILANEDLLPHPERDELLALLEANDWNQRATARKMGTSESTLRWRLNRLNIERAKKSH